MQGTFALSYLIQLTLARVLGFFRHWYVNGSRFWWRRYLRAAQRIEDALAARTMLHLLFRPLYGDYSIVGRILGPIFRSGRLAIGLVVHTALMLASLALWLVWVAIPPLLIVYAAGLLRL